MLSDMNMGQKIMLRLRPHHSPTWFLEEEEILQTMLHEVSTLPLHLLTV
jgi:hypothetical protein